MPNGNGKPYNSLTITFFPLSASMPDINKLLKQLASQEKALQNTQFLAPCVAGGFLRTSVANIIYTFTPQPPSFTGWGIFQAINPQAAELVTEASLPQITTYLELLPPLRLRLSYQIKQQTWLAYPINESDMQQRFGEAKPIVVYLVDEGGQFEPIIARFQGSHCWFETIDRRAEPQPTETLAAYLHQEIPPQEVKFPGLTPEMLTTYQLAWQQTENALIQKQHRQQVEGNQLKHKSSQNPEIRLQQALQQGGGEMRNYRDRDGFWQVEWITADGQFHTSAISKEDLTVVSAGICLSGRDRDFDLQSLVGVMEQEYD